MEGGEHSEAPIPEPPARGGRRTREHWVILGLAVATFLGLLVLALLLRPDERGFGTHEQLGLQPCMPMELWNIPCPGCGVTTSVSMAVHGDVWGSIRNQPFGFLVALFFVIFALGVPIAHFLGRDLGRDLMTVRYGLWAKLTVTFMVLAWVYKLALVQGWLGI